MAMRDALRITNNQRPMKMRVSVPGSGTGCAALMNSTLGYARVTVR